MSNIFSIENAVEVICNDVCIHACLVNTTLPNPDMYTQLCRQLVKGFGKANNRVPGYPTGRASRVPGSDFWTRFNH